MFKHLLITTLAFMPSFVLAAGVPTYKELVGKVAGILQSAVGIIFWLIFFYVAWTLIQNWARHGDDPKAVTAGKSTLLAGVIGLVILGSLWGLVAFVRDVLLN
ncbi:hypothetical protein A3C87_01650 [Candidatus Kaiserbacteria bacterium RIFCSPHIGHO2_02_FULL_49_34]|uniref:Uncharacterized protein n=1 Tax=Candidatus Kaiserbacteria bacterium RIFCSPHIGHO2_02_FULL_49_34 TaxID=1798491 RepID=A0A1F6DIM6_9BACT|nr:MAG: hypothetical protein A3C87_01650 [Candidatus Kaiserbacteria bacterium RIFCSPHIGHO2_02_FULL_49_34]